MRDIELKNYLISCDDKICSKCGYEGEKRDFIGGECPECGDIEEDPRSEYNHEDKLCD